LFPSEFLVEVGSIGCALDRGEIRWWDPLVVDVIKVDIFEEEVPLNVLCVGFASTQSSSRISSE